jgi:hypothetical protein
MDNENRRKLNQLQHILPEGLVVDAGWLESKGYSSALRSRYAANDWLKQPARGAYRRPGGKLQWQQIVISLQNLLGLPFIVGGRTALELQGFSHYVAAGGVREVHLYGEKQFPGWVKKLDIDVRFVFHNSKKLFRTDAIARSLGSVGWNLKDQTVTTDDPIQGSLTQISWGQWDWPITISTPERAILELLDEVPVRETFHQADKLVEGLRTLSPRRLQTLLEDCSNIKVKRLFLWFAERHQFQWLHQVEQERIDLGKGKRMIVRGGKFDSKFLITVPQNLDGGQ